MIRKVQYISIVEEFPMNMWDVVVTEWVVGKLVLLRKVFFRTCHGYDSKIAKPYTTWYVTGGQTGGFGGLEEQKADVPQGCMWVSGKAERVVS